MSAGYEGQLEQTQDSQSQQADLIEWRMLGLQADLKLQQQDFAALGLLGRRLCNLHPQFARGWLLRHLALQHQGVTPEDRMALLQKANVACNGGHGVEQLTMSLQQEASSPGITSANQMCRPEPTDGVQEFEGEWDAEGVYVYQAFCDDIAEWALRHQEFGGPKFDTKRMTWIKPSFAWVLYRSGYGQKNGQTRVSKINISHKSLAQILSDCKCVDTNKSTRTQGEIS
eukprot:TRINITY_DN43515_c0_g1_i1.p1 TRINITY_DN43515_c0_g1~~TRINITY_DN43515_c0_g1_i1.p1  ORF type:complete len:228 (+),score=35.98 TRINITY_DN43515_c0_g1_i1:52-735(+)